MGWVGKRAWGNSGFTLWELLLVLALASILALAFMPKVNFGTVPHKAAIEKLKFDIRYAQWMAMNRKLVYGIAFDEATEAYNMYQTLPANIITDPQNPAESYSVDYITNKKFRNVDLNDVDINGTAVLEFDGRGIPCDANHAALAAAGTITLGLGAKQTIIRIEPVTGMVSE